MIRYLVILLGLLGSCSLVDAHAPPVYIPTPPFRLQGRSLIDATNSNFLLRGVQVPDLNHANALTFRVIQQRWNMNTVRVPVSVSEWKRGGADYLNRVQDVVRAGTEEHLVVVLAAKDDSSG